MHELLWLEWIRMHSFTLSFMQVRNFDEKSTRMHISMTIPIKINNNLFCNKMYVIEISHAIINYKLKMNHNMDKNVKIWKCDEMQKWPDELKIKRQN